MLDLLGEVVLQMRIFSFSSLLFEVAQLLKKFSMANTSPFDLRSRQATNPHESQGAQRNERVQGNMRAGGIHWCLHVDFEIGKYS